MNLLLLIMQVIVIIFSSIMLFKSRNIIKIAEGILRDLEEERKGNSNE